MPRIIGPVPSDRWEREVRGELLRQLPDSWIVVCNVSWAIKGERGEVRDGQADFVVLAPDFGLAVVEVKGSKEVRVGEDGEWYVKEWRQVASGGEKKLKRPPPEQASSNMHQLAELVAKELGLREKANFPGLFAFVVAYPNGKVVGYPSTYDASTIVEKNKIHQLSGVIRAALLARGDDRKGSQFTPNIADRVAKILSNQQFKVVAVDTNLDVMEDEKSIDELTRQQFAALRGAFELPRVAIIGPAGSGKTLLAIWKLSALLEEGRKAIYVCFNKALAEHLRKKHPDFKEAIQSVDVLFRQLVQDKSGSNLPDFFTAVLPNRVMDKSIDLNPSEKYENIIIDEAQDFGQERLTALFYLLRDEDSQWLYFGDNKQDLYAKGTSEALGAEVTFRLYHNCRNTALINAATNKVCSANAQPMPGVPRGEIPRIYPCKHDHMSQRAWALVNELSQDGGAVILSPFQLEKSCMALNRKAYGMELTEDINKLGQKGFVYFSTIHSFKGLEASHVIFVDADKPDSSKALTDEAMYVAFTRATARLDVVTAKQEAADWFNDLLGSPDKVMTSQF